MLDGHDFYRFIPADAGNAWRTRHCAAQSPVHPRGRGERGFLYMPRQSIAGSSPRTRGTLIPAWRRARRTRFIPADAGNALRHPSFVPPDPVHPRGRGERAGVNMRAWSPTGSSPRTRGTRHRVHARNLHHRFIPADAGNADIAFLFCCARPVHPRGRGEREGEAVSSAFTAGSSPRTRGTLLGESFLVTKYRFIPADAGNALRSALTTSMATVHPRGRGERLSTASCATPRTGSSPRTRGTPRLPRRSARKSRFIPADAGNAPLA